MPSHFSTIGFQMENIEQFKLLTLSAAQLGERISSPRGDYIRYTPGAGVELWVQVSSENAVRGCTPHFSGQGRMCLGVTKLLPDDAHPQDGCLYGWVNPSEDDPEHGDYPVAIDVPDFALVEGRLQPPMAVVLQVAAFAHELRCFPTEAAYHQGKEEFHLAAEAFIPSGLFHPGGELKNPVRAEAVLSGRIMATERRINPATEREFYWLLVTTYGATADVVADPLLLDAAPQIGGVVQGSFWLSGRVVH